MQRALAEDAVARKKSAVRSRRRVSDRKRRARKNKRLYEEMTAEQRWASAQAAFKERSDARARGVREDQLPQLEDWQWTLIGADADQFMTLPEAEYRLLKTPEDRPTPPPPYVAKRMDYKHYVELRLSEGFVLDQACSLGDRPYLIDEFHEEGLRSEHDWTFYRFVWDTPAAENRRQGDEAAEVFLSGGKHSLAPTFGKMWGLDQSHIVRTKKFRRVIRVELDWDFASIEALIYALLHVAKLPILPNVVAFNRTLDGAVGGAHLWFELAGAPVWFSSDERCSKDAQLLYRKVIIALTKALRVIGADMAGAVSPTAGKNPLAPINCGAVLNNTSLYTLKEWANWLGPERLDVDLAYELRESILQKADADGVERKVSQPLFLAAREHAWNICGLACQSGKNEFGQLCRLPPVDRSRLRDIIFDRLLLVADEWEKDATTDLGRRRLLMNVANAVAKEWDPKKRTGKRKRNRGLMRGGLDHLDNTHDRQSAGATMHTHIARRVETVWKCRRAVIKLGPKASFKAIAEEAGVRQARTVRRNWTAIEMAQHLTEKSALWTLLGGYEGIPHSLSNRDQSFVNKGNSETEMLGDFDLVVEDRDRPLLRLKSDIAGTIQSTWIVELDPGVVRHNPKHSLPLAKDALLIVGSGDIIEANEGIADVVTDAPAIDWGWWDEAARIEAVEQSVREAMSGEPKNAEPRVTALEPHGTVSSPGQVPRPSRRESAVPGALARRYRRRQRIERKNLALVGRIFDMGREAGKIGAVAYVRDVASCRKVGDGGHRHAADRTATAQPAAVQPKADSG